jgi:DNA-binding CsgD family transcriptional regulator
MALSGGPAAFLRFAQTLQNRPAIQVLAASPMGFRDLVRFVVETILPVDFPQLCFSTVEASDTMVCVFVTSHEVRAGRPPEAVVLLLAGLLSSLRGQTAATRPPLPSVEAFGDGFRVSLSAPDNHFRPRIPAQARLDEVFAELSNDLGAGQRELTRGLVLAGRLATRGITATGAAEACAEVVASLEESTVGAVSLWLHEPGGHTRYAGRGELDAFSVPVPLVRRERPIGLLELAPSGVSDFVAATAPRLARHLAPFANDATTRAAQRRTWTELEATVARGAAEGRSVKELAQTLDVSTSKIAAIQTQLFRDLGIRSRRSLVDVWLANEGGLPSDGPEGCPAPVSTTHLRQRPPAVATVSSPEAATVPSLALVPTTPATPGTIAQLHRQRLAALAHRRRELAWVRDVLCADTDAADDEKEPDLAM